MLLSTSKSFGILYYNKSELREEVYFRVSFLYSGPSSSITSLSMFQLLRLFPRRFVSTSPVLGQAVKSSCPAGTIINVNTKKSGKDPVALEDNEYPDWLWEVLDPEAQMKKLQADPMKLRKKQLRKDNREKIKQNNFLKQI
ncbi:hypothetical protein ZYGR_0AD06360 [Zygosaccharomyces rouxii]|uniref:Large ribosomal subunit protein mL54 n=2 Tax=Zygosaccharomyces rouxii TaxID=4956 RepID=C5E1G1_ZYGRC|nr:uncharacterized protein ZYRO0G20702g [Zygosaccharomyces rouxii]GAV51453.1 hypothetical protein ZYGR_0AD06360 [Zygosaccharomyces rouxii]CAR29945.1 ZYRO0G20702p [Zygosaccharomyces rouxii]